jgi:glyoxylase-like metal-dependent hydrolase (beta-lactamase superfamily II)
MAEPATGVPIQLEPLVARVLAPNPSPYTAGGTNSYMVGTGDLAVIDPGPDDPRHLNALLAAIDGRPVRAIVITHHHRDHSPLSRPLAAATGAPIVGAAPFTADTPGSGEAAFDADYRSDRVMAEGDEVAGEGWTLAAIATPGHTSNHLAFALPRGQGGAGTLFSGDHVMGFSTSVVSPPNGDMGAYMASLKKLILRGDTVYYPGHGDPVERPQRLVRHMLGHRRQREAQVLRHLRDGGEQTLSALTPPLYVGLDPRLLGAAERTVLAHLIELERRGLARDMGEGRWAGVSA